MTDEQFQQLIDLLGQMGNAVYAIAVRQAQVEAASSVIWAFAFVLCLIGGYRMFRKGLSTYQEEKYDIMPMFGLMFGGIGITAGVIGTATCLTTVIHYALNPQWAALVKLSELVR